MAAAATMLVLAELAMLGMKKKTPPPATPEPVMTTEMMVAAAAVLVSLILLVTRSKFSTFSPAKAKGGCEVVAKKTALVCIEFQNEFASDGGKLYGAVKSVMRMTDMLKKVAALQDTVRSAGGKVIHAPITFKADASDNPNKAIGILAGCAKDSLFTAGTWNADFCAATAPQKGDPIVKGKKGLDAFPNTNLEKLLKSNGIETVALCGFLTNCCVESTMRTACEKGFNVITITDGCATTAKDGHKAAVEGTFGMFSTPMTAKQFGAKFAADVAATPTTKAAM